MARTIDAIVQEMLGAQAMAIAQMRAQIEALEERNKALSPSPEPPAPEGGP
jgi:uncharacterized coiled-coil protein SlyX